MHWFRNPAMLLSMTAMDASHFCTEKVRGRATLYLILVTLAAAQHVCITQAFILGSCPWFMI